MSADWDERRMVIGRPDHGARLDAFLCRELDWLSRREVRELVDAGAVVVEQHRDPVALQGETRPAQRLRTGQQVSVRVARVSRDPSPPGPPAEPLHEDGRFLVFDKPAGQTVYPNGVLLRPSLVEEVHRWWRQRQPPGCDNAAGSEWMPSPCHRLDRETSGVVVFAKNPQARALVGEALEERRVEKTYLALVCGEVASDQGVIDLPIGPAVDSSVRSRQEAAIDLKNARSARTEFLVRERLAGRTVVELRPRTGRQHQLRVHMAALGHPLVGDKLYLGGDELFLRSIEDRLEAQDLELLGHPRQALHAWRFQFQCPGQQTTETVTFEAPLAADLRGLLDGKPTADPLAREIEDRSADRL
jgi:23S rRNA pseudouridine1911/1915/1917 synthase